MIFKFMILFDIFSKFCHYL